MAIEYHPDPGTIVICDYSGFKEPEMVKRRPAVVLSPRLRQRDNLCTVVPLSTTRPRSICDFHCELVFDPPLPAPYSEPRMWVKADMMAAVSFARLQLPFEGKDLSGRRIYAIRHLTEAEFATVQRCVLHGLGLSSLTKYI